MSSGLSLKDATLTSYEITGDHVKEIIAGNLGVGAGQTWQDVAASRASGVTYTNTTGRPIVVHVYEVIGTASHTSYITVDGVTININADGGANNKQSTQLAIIPDGSTYSWVTNAVIAGWYELR